MKRILVSLLAFLSTFAYGEPFKGTASWQATGNPGMVKIDGEGGLVTGTVTRDGGKVAGTFECPLKDFQTGIDTRDHHMREKYLDTAKFPVAQLVLDPLAATGGDWTGKLTLKGVTKPVKGTAKITGSAVDATFSIQLADYPIGVPSFLGVTVAQDVTIHITGASSK